MFLKRQIWKNLGIAITAAVLITAIYDRLLHVSFRNSLWHSAGVTGLGPAYNLVFRYFDPRCDGGYGCYFEVLATNVFLYVLWIFAVLLFIALLLQLKQRFSDRKA